MARQPRLDFGMFVGGVVVNDGVDYLVRWDIAFNLIEEADELLMPLGVLGRCMLRPMTVPSSTFRAANKVVVPLRL